MAMIVFRQEVFQAMAARWVGRVRLTRAPSTWAVVATVVAMSGGLVAYLVLGHYTRVAHVPGVLLPQGGQMNVMAPAAGVLQLLKVKQGDVVKAGDVLAELNVGRSTRSGAGSDDVSSLISQQIELRKRSLLSDRRIREEAAHQRLQSVVSRLKALDGELDRLKVELSLQQSKVELAKKRADRSARLVQEGFLSPSAEQDQAELILDQQSRLKTLERGGLSLQRERESLLSEQQQIASQLASELSGSDRELATLGQEAVENLARRQSVVVAPEDGVVTAISVSSGQTVSAGQSMLAIAPQGAPLEAVLYAPSHSAGFVLSGQKVRLRYAGFPYQKFGLYGGTVSAVSQSAISPSELPPAQQALFANRANNESLYRIAVTLDSQTVAAYGEPQPLKAGMAVDSDIVQDRRRIVEWLFEPVLAFQRRAS